MKKENWGNSESRLLFFLFFSVRGRGETVKGLYLLIEGKVGGDGREVS